MTMTKTKAPLREGLREGDLADLVLPMISVDEYESRIDKSQAIVIGFYVQDENAANDLNRFVQKSALPLLGTEVSPAPDQHGYFMVFVEFMNNDRLAENVAAMLHEMIALASIDEWAMRVRKFKSLVPFSEDRLTKMLKQLKQTGQQRDIMEFLGTTGLRRAEVDGDILLIEGNGEKLVLQILGFGRGRKLLAEHGGPLQMTLRSIAKTNRIARILGENWHAAMLGDNLLVHSDHDTRALLLAF
jgi:hypothetical protein